ncbi:hypothetical protein LCGC14_1539590 [marine sediment metagenome]|uniref:Uncharacterized protein n=1 Tax=marine sediment metagenome TaxID=412755 RepID=A0A0F9LU71_9ZZZZ
MITRPEPIVKGLVDWRGWGVMDYPQEGGGEDRNEERRKEK